MQLTVKRYGGLMAMKPKERVYEIEDLEPAARKAVHELAANPPAAASSATTMPDGFVYSFEFGADAKPDTKVELSGRDVPDPLRKLLP